MARYKFVDMSPLLLPVDLEPQLVTGTFAHAVHHVAQHLRIPCARRMTPPLRGRIDACTDPIVMKQIEINQLDVGEESIDELLYRRAAHYC